MSFTLKGIFGNHSQDSSDPSAARAASRKSSITRPGSGADLPGSDSRRVSQSSQIDPSRISAPISSKKVSVTVASSFVAPRSSKGWSPSEWSHWARDGGNSVHRGTRNIILLGIDNFGNSCYVNSVIQALYHCKPFRDAIMDVYTTQAAPPIPAPRVERETGTMYTVLARLFHTMALMATRLSVDPAAGIKRQAPGVPPIVQMTVNQEPIKTFLNALQRNCDLFDSSMHHGAHEFLNFLLNQVGEDLTAGKSTGSTATSSYVHLLFQGVLTNETRCLACETVSHRDEEFLDLSINVSGNTSVSSSLRHFSESEMLTGRNKFFCDACSCLQEAEKRMKIWKAPNILALHLKRFKWEESAQAYKKHACRVVFPLDLRLFNSSEEAQNPDRYYELFAIVIHVGVGAHQGHYISIIKIGSRWALFDDETVEFIPESDIGKYYGDAPEVGSAYVLFYQAADVNTNIRPTTSENASTSDTQMFSRRTTVAASNLTKTSGVSTSMVSSPLQETLRVGTLTSPLSSPANEKRSSLSPIALVSPTPTSPSIMSPQPSPAKSSLRESPGRKSLDVWTMMGSNSSQPKMHSRSSSLLQEQPLSVASTELQRLDDNSSATPSQTSTPLLIHSNKTSIPALQNATQARARQRSAPAPMPSGLETLSNTTYASSVPGSGAKPEKLSPQDATTARSNSAQDMSSLHPSRAEDLPTRSSHMQEGSVYSPVPSLPGTSPATSVPGTSPVTSVPSTSPSTSLTGTGSPVSVSGPSLPSPMLASRMAPAASDTASQEKDTGDFKPADPMSNPNSMHVRVQSESKRKSWFGRSFGRQQH